jgi:hypothetical protein
MLRSLATPPPHGLGVAFFFACFKVTIFYDISLAEKYIIIPILLISV